jgi:hypothetical protein
MASIRTAAAAALLTGGLAIAGCGGGASGSASTPTPPATTPPRARPAPEPPAARASDERVIRHWTSALRHSHVAAASRWFGLPAVVQGTPDEPDGVLRTRREVEAFNASLPCGAVVIRTEKRGAYAETLFRLVPRPGLTCDGPGHTARAAFRIRDGRIIEWRRRLDQPNDATVVPREPHGGDSGSAPPPPA